MQVLSLASQFALAWPPPVIGMLGGANAFVSLDGRFLALNRALARRGVPVMCVELWNVCCLLLPQAS